MSSWPWSSTSGTVQSGRVRRPAAGAQAPPGASPVATTAFQQGLKRAFDVVRGDMSLVGPRPLPTCQVDLDHRWARSRLRVKPGVTGLWQVSGRHRLSFDELVHHDLRYVESWSFAMA